MTKQKKNKKKDMALPNMTSLHQDQSSTPVSFPIHQKQFPRAPAFKNLIWEIPLTAQYSVHVCVVHQVGCTGTTVNCSGIIDQLTLIKTLMHAECVLVKRQAKNSQADSYILID